jgi:ABC-type polysaccharide/polyol phosphate export permease
MYDRTSLPPALPTHYAAAKTSFAAELKAGTREVRSSLENNRIWLALGLNDILARYRGSILGPFWITLTTAVFVLGIGFLYAGLMKVSTDRYLPWMTTGVVVWGLINQTVLESADSLIAASAVLRQTAIPIPVFVWRVVWRNLLTFAHQLPVIVVVAAWFHFLLHMDVLRACLGVVLILINVSWFGLIAAIAAARFRDLQQVLASITQLVFFLSPVLWIPSDVKGFGGIFVMLNPVVHMLNVVRGPILGQGFSRFSALYLVGLAVIGWSLSLLMFCRVRRRIGHYV